jgi:AraC family transcriptional regulator
MLTGPTDLADLAGARRPTDSNASIGSHTDLSATVVRLLTNASETLDRDREAAKRYIAYASALLQSKDRNNPDLEGTAGCFVRGGLAPWLMNRLKAYVEDHLASRVTVNELTTIARLSPSHFSRAFKRSFGMSPSTFVARRRVERARHLMLTTDEPLCQIALACGLTNQSHLSRLFRRTIGTSPNAWRRQHCEGPPASPTWINARWRLAGKVTAGNNAGGDQRPRTEAHGRTLIK